MSVQDLGASSNHFSWFSDDLLFKNKELQRAGNFDDVEAFQLVAFHNFVVAFDH